MPENLLASRFSKSLRAAFGAALLLVLLTYANHFENGFHFDDGHSVVDNPWIRDILNVPRFFVDGSTFSTLPPNRSYRPLVTTTLAFDYWMGHGLQPFWFHLSTFILFLAQLSLMFVLFRRILDRARPDAESNPWIALFATTLYAVHPATAETVNYVIQRADLHAALGVVAGLVVYALYPGARRFGLYLIPAILGLLGKQSAAVFPALLFLYIWFFEEESFPRALKRSLPGFVTLGAAALFSAKMNPATFVTGATQPWAYRLSQPAVLRDYFRKFFLPVDLTADTDRVASASLANPDLITGFIFLALFCLAIWWAMRTRERRPIAFGLAWFLIASLPTSLIALAEVENDHRMFFPFVGVTLAICQGVALLLEYQASGRRAIPRPAIAAGCCALLIVFALGTRERNRVWRTDESLWKDVTVKSPKNGRGLMNYGLTKMEKGDYATAQEFFERAAVLNPTYYILETNLGIVYGATRQAVRAEAHFARAMQLAPTEVIPRYFYSRWLHDSQRLAEAEAQLEAAVELNPDYIPARHLLMKVYTELGDDAKLRLQVQQTLARFPADPVAGSYHPIPSSPAAANQPRANQLRANQTPNPVGIAPESPEGYLNRSLLLYQARQFPACIEQAKQALKLRPNYPEAWNNIAAAYNSMSEWDRGIAAADQAIRLRPDYQLAKNNRAWAVSQKALHK